MPMSLKDVLNMDTAREFGNICSECGKSALNIKAGDICKDCQDVILGNLIEENPIGIPRSHQTTH